MCSSSFCSSRLEVTFRTCAVYRQTQKEVFCPYTTYMQTCAHSQEQTDKYTSISCLWHVTQCSNTLNCTEMNFSFCLFRCKDANFWPFICLCDHFSCRFAKCCTLCKMTWTSCLSSFINRDDIQRKKRSIQKNKLGKVLICFFIFCLKLLLTVTLWNR